MVDVVEDGCTHEFLWSNTVDLESLHRHAPNPTGDIGVEDLHAWRAVLLREKAGLRPHHRKMRQGILVQMERNVDVPEVDGRQVRTEFKRPAMSTQRLGSLLLPHTVDWSAQIDFDVLEEEISACSDF